MVGADILAKTHEWNDWAGIVARFPPIVVGRGGYPEVPGVPTFPEVSSTAIRAALVAGEPIDALVPSTVLRVLTEGEAAAILRRAADGHRT